MTTTTAQNQPLHDQLTKPAGRSFLNDALEEAAKRRVITTDAVWSSPDTDDEPLPGDESRRAMSAAVRAAAGYTDSTDNEE